MIHLSPFYIILTSFCSQMNIKMFISLLKLFINFQVVTINIPSEADIMVQSEVHVTNTALPETEKIYF